MSARRVLVVEDDPLVAMIVEEILGDMGLEVLVVLSLENALLEIDASEIHAVVLDMHLRGESGHPMVLALLEHAVPFVVISGGDQSALVREFPQIQVLAKPFGRDQLETAVRSLLARARAG